MSTGPVPPQAPPPSGSPAQPSGSWWTQKSPVFSFFVVLLAVAVLLTWGLQSVGKSVISSLEAQSKLPTHGSSNAASNDSSEQAQAEALLQRVASGDSAATDQVLNESDQWRGKTQRTSKADQFLTVSLNSSDIHMRQASLQAELALDGVERNEAGLDRLEPALKDPSQREWALWMVAALGNRGVDPQRAAIMISAYLQDPDTNTRAAAVNAFAMLGTDATILLVLDRFRNDPSPVVQERAACGLAQSGMYTHEQRMTAATTLVRWLDDARLTQQQHAWTLQALRDISGKNIGTDSSEWQSWLDGAQ